METVRLSLLSKLISISFMLHVQIQHLYMPDVHDLCKASLVSIWQPQVSIWQPQVTNWQHSDLPLSDLLLSDLLTTLLRDLGNSLHQKELFISFSNAS